MIVATHLHPQPQPRGHAPSIVHDCARRWIAPGVAALALAFASVAQSQSAPRLAPRALSLAWGALPFAVGERLSYDAHAGPGLNGRAEMWIEGPEEIRGTTTMVLRFTFAARVGFLHVDDNTTSWLDPIRMSALRFVKEEHHLMARHSEDVTMEPMTRHWSAADGRSGTSPTTAPLDELSFMYAVRTFSLSDDSAIVLDRHFDAERSPTTLRMLGRDTITTPAGTFATREIEMRVRDAHNYKGEGVIRFSLSDDACRRPLRIESRIPGAGTVVLTLSSALPRIAACLPMADAP